MTTHSYSGHKTEIPLIDLHAQYLSLKEEIDTAIFNCVQNSDFIGGETVRKFEQDFARFLGNGELVSCANGTDSLEMILQALDIEKGDEVIVPAMTWISTSEVVVRAGATAVFVDVEPDGGCIDPEKVEQAINKKTKAIICVHLYGRAARLDLLSQIAEQHGIYLIEDCAQAHGTTFKGKKAGNFGIAASFSFYPGKNLGCYGDGGAVYTHDPVLAKKVRMIANHGQEEKHRHIIHGRNSRLDAIQAAILSVKLPHLQNWIEAKRALAKAYKSAFQNTYKLQLPEDTEGHSYHLYVIQTENRAQLKAQLEKSGIQTAIHYPLALPLQACYEKLGYERKDFPVSVRMQECVLSIPMYAELEIADLNYISQIIKQALTA